MGTSTQKVYALGRLGTRGQITIPAEYRRALGLSSDTDLMLIPVGDALVIAPQDERLADVTGRLEARLHAVGQDVDDLLQAAAQARAEILREEFGESGDNERSD